MEYFLCKSFAIKINEIVFNRLSPFDNEYIYSLHIPMFLSSSLQLLPSQTQTPLWVTVVDLLTLLGQLLRDYYLKQDVDKKRDFKCKSSSKVKASPDAGYKKSISDHSYPIEIFLENCRDVTDSLSRAYFWWKDRSIFLFNSNRICRIEAFFVFAIISWELTL